MRGDWKDEAMQYRDIDRAAQAKAEEEIRMTTKYTPATPLPWHWLSLGALQRSEGAENERNYVGTRSQRDGEFAVHAANAYPRLIAALSELLGEIDCLEDVTYTRDIEPYKAEANWNDVNARAKILLRELGEE